MKNKKQVKPKWFNGVVYQEGATVRNQFSGETCKLNALELSIYDFVMGANMTLEMLFDRDTKPNNKIKKLTKDLYKGLDWFRTNNVKAYYILLD